MSPFDLTVYILKFFIPAFFSVLFRAFGLGYRSKRRLTAGLLAFTVYTAVVPALLITVMGYGQFTHVSNVVMTVAGLSVLIFSTDSPGKTIFLQLVQGNVTTAVSVLLNMIRHVCGLTYLDLVWMLLAICPVVYLLALRFWAKPLRFIADHVHGDLPSLLALPVVTMVLVYLLPIYPVQNFALHPIFCTAMMLGMELSFFLYIYTFYRNLRQIHLLSTQEMRWKLMQSEMEAYQDYIQTARQNRHDLRHHDALLLEYLENGNVDGAIAYLRTRDETLIASALKTFCKNAIANAVFRIYERRTQADGIRFSVAADIPERLPLSEPEFGGVLSNMLENAQDACKGAEGEAHIIVSATLADGNLLLELRNTVVRPTNFRDGMPVSQKPGGGTGTRSIVSTVRQCGGIVEFSQKNGEFFTRIILPLKNNP